MRPFYKNLLWLNGMCRLHVHKIPRFFFWGGGIWVFFWGGSADFIFMGARIFLIKSFPQLN